MPGSFEIRLAESQGHGIDFHRNYEPRRPDHLPRHSLTPNRFPGRRVLHQDQAVRKRAGNYAGKTYALQLHSLPRLRSTCQMECGDDRLKRTKGIDLVTGSRGPTREPVVRFPADRDAAEGVLVNHEASLLPDHVLIRPIFAILPHRAALAPFFPTIVTSQPHQRRFEIAHLLALDAIVDPASF